MKKKIKCFKQDNKWYADIPNHTLEENEMVMGSDIALDLLSKGKKEIVLEVSDEYSNNTLLHFNLKKHDSEGAYYGISGILYNEFAEVLTNELGIIDHEIWICNVTHDVFGEHPKDIYITNIE